MYTYPCPLVQVYTASPNYSESRTYYSSSKSNPPANTSSDNNLMESSIESGPSFNESLQRFKTASGQNAQMASWKKSAMKTSSTSSSSSLQKRVEETRTMITHSSQKSYHIE